MKYFYALLTLFVCLTTNAQDIYFDQNYAGIGGISSPPFYGSAYYSASLGLVVDANNKSYHFGYAESINGFEFACAKLDAIGALDGSFSSNGMSEVDGGYVIENIEGADVYSNGSVLVCGSFLDPDQGTYGGIVYRLNAAGSLDQTFNGNQTAFYFQSPDTYNVKGIGCAVLNSGAGYAAFSYENDNGVQVVIVRFNSSGVFDATFGESGYKLINTSSYMEMNEFKDDGSSLFLCGSMDGFDSVDGVVIKLNAVGNFSPGFGNGETASTEAGNALYNLPQAMCFDEDGNIYVTGISSSGDTFVSMLNASGDLVTSFGNQGMVTLSNSLDLEASDIDLTPGGNVIVGGTEKGGDSDRAFISRFTAGGVLDTSFDGDGIYYPDFGTVEHYITGIHVLDDGGLLTTGYGVNASDIQRFLCAKFLMTETGVENLFDQGPDIFPNPAGDLVFVTNYKRTISSVSISDIRGQVVREVTVNSLQMPIDVSDLASGQYLFKAVDSEGNVWSKVVVIM